MYDYIYTLFHEFFSTFLSNNISFPERRNKRKSVSTFRETDVIRKKCRNFFVEQGIGIVCMSGLTIHT